MDLANEETSKQIEFVIRQQISIVIRNLVQCKSSLQIEGLLAVKIDATKAVLININESLIGQVQPEAVVYLNKCMDGEDYLNESATIEKITEYCKSNRINDMSSLSDFSSDTDCNNISSPKQYSSNKEVQNEHNNLQDNILCNACGKIFTMEICRTEHEMVEHKKFYCNLCKHEYKSECEWRKHTKRKHDGFLRDFDRFCKKNKLKESKAKKKLMIPKSSSLTEKRLTRSDKKAGICFSCPYPTCSLKFSNNNTFLSHIERHKSRNNKELHYVICEFCQESFELDSDLDEHIINDHNETDEELFISPTNVCENCNQTFKSRASYLHHMADNCTHIDISDDSEMTEFSNCKKISVDCESDDET